MERHFFSSAKQLTAVFIASFTARLACAGLLAVSLSGHADERTRYIRDWMSVPLHASAAPDSKTVHNGLVSGTQITVLESGDDYSRVRTTEGVEGWIATRYLTDEPIARAQLDQANSELAELRKLKVQLENLPPDARAAAQQLIDARTENARLQTELEASQKTPTEAAQLQADNSRLQTANDALQQQLLALNTELQMLHTGAERTQFRDGALAVVAGMLVALAIRRLWPKKRSEWA